MVQCFLRNDRRLSFCEVMHFEAIRRKQDSTYQDVAFFTRRFVAFDEKKVKQKPVPYTHQDVTFLRRRFAPFVGKKR